MISTETIYRDNRRYRRQEVTFEGLTTVSWYVRSWHGWTCLLDEARDDMERWYQNTKAPRPA